MNTLSRTTYVGIDPGRSSGGIAYRTSNAVVPVTYKMPDNDADVIDLLSFIYTETDDLQTVVAIEAIPNFVGSNRTASAIIKVKGHGMWLLGVSQGMAKVYKERPIIVHNPDPKYWQKILNISKKQKDMSQPAWKRQLKDAATKRFPTAKVTNNTADALLLMEAARLLSNSPGEMLDY